MPSQNTKLELLKRRFNPKRLFFYIVLALTLVFILMIYHSYKPLPKGLSFQGEQLVTKDVDFLIDTTWVDSSGKRHIEQNIFNEIFRVIDTANELIVADMFLYNDFQGPIPETTRQLANELAEALISKKLQHPDMNIIVITDPVNTLYGGLPSPYFTRLEAVGIRVVITDLSKLRDSNFLYSPFWRLFAKPFGNTQADTLSNPIGAGRVSLRSYFELINFKANHRKVLIADQGNTYVGVVTSANPHDGSSAHRNSAIRFTGAAVVDLLKTENAVLSFSGEAIIEFNKTFESVETGPTVQVVTESKIKDALLSQLGRAAATDEVDVMVFYLSDRDIINALKQAQQRGVRLRVLLDPNKDAFGRKKNGIPNRPVAHELVAANIPVRWCRSLGEQCHTKMLLIKKQKQSSVLISGSANWTRRNLDDFNLETDVVVEGVSNTPVFLAAQKHFDDMWTNSNGRGYSVEHQQFEDNSWWHRQLYRFMEFSGMSTF